MSRRPPHSREPDLVDTPPNENHRSNVNEDVFEDQPSANQVDDLQQQQHTQPSPNARTQPAQLQQSETSNATTLSPQNIRAHRKSLLVQKQQQLQASFAAAVQSPSRSFNNANKNTNHDHQSDETSSKRKNRFQEIDALIGVIGGEDGDEEQDDTTTLEQLHAEEQLRQTTHQLQLEIDEIDAEEENERHQRLQERKHHNITLAASSPARTKPFNKLSEKVADREAEKEAAIKELIAAQRKRDLQLQQQKQQEHQKQQQGAPPKEDQLSPSIRRTYPTSESFLASLAAAAHESSSSSPSSSVLNSTDNTKKLKYLKRVAPHQSSWFQWRPTDGKQLEHAEKIILAPVYGRFIQDKIETLNTLSFPPNTYIIDKLKETLTYLNELANEGDSKNRKEKSSSNKNKKKNEKTSTTNEESNINSDKSKQQQQQQHQPVFDKDLFKNHVVLRHTILLHGMGAGACIWLPQLKHFGDLFDKKNLFAASKDGLLDLLGEGGSAAFQDGSAVHANADASSSCGATAGENSNRLLLSGATSPMSSLHTDPFGLATLHNASSSIRNIDGTDCRKSFFGSSFANPAKILQQLNNEQKNSSKINNNEDSVGATASNSRSDRRSSNSVSPSSRKQQQQRRSVSPSTAATLQQQAAKLKTLQDDEIVRLAREQLKTKKIVINILHAIDLPGYARSDRDENIDDFDSPDEANRYMIDKLHKWSVAMDLDNVEKWILETKLKPKDTIVRVVREDVEIPGGNVNNDAKLTSGVSPTRSIRSPASSPSPGSKRSDPQQQQQQQQQPASNDAAELSIKSHAASSPTKPKDQQPRSRSVVVLLDGTTSATSSASPNEPTSSSHHPQAARSASPEASEPTSNNDALIVVIPPSAISEADEQQQQITDPQSKSDAQPRAVPKRIGANYSFRRKSTAVEEHFKNFEESTRDARRKSLSQHVLNRPPEKNNNSDDDEEETDDDDESNSENEFYRDPENSSRYDPLPGGKHNNNNKSTSLVALSNGEASSSKIFGSSRREEVRSSRFIAPGEDSTFQRKRRRSSSRSLDASGRKSGNDNNNSNDHDDLTSKIMNLDANFDHDIKLFASEFEKTAERESVHTFLTTKLRSKDRRSHVTVVAHSYGAYLSATWACEHPDFMDHLILADVWGMVPRPSEEEDPEFWNKVPCFLKCIAGCYSCTKSLPFTAIRKAGSWGPSILQTARADYTARWSSILPDPIYFYDFVYHANAQEPATGEIAITANSDAYGFTARPLQSLLIKKLPVRVDLSFIYGDKTFMDRGAGFDLSEILRTQRMQVFEAGKKVVEDDIRKDEAKWREERAKREQFEDEYDREFGAEKKAEKEAAELAEIRERHERRLPRVGKLTYEIVFAAGHQVTTENVFEFNRLVEGAMEI